MTLLSVGRRSLTGGSSSRSRRHGVLLSLSAVLVDLLVITVVGTAAALGREQITYFVDSATVVGTLGLAAPLILVSWMFGIFLMGGYQPHLFGAGSEEYKRVVNATLAVAGVVGIGCYLASFELSRGFFLLTFVMGVPAIAYGRFFLRRAIQRARRQGRLRLRVLIAGSRAHVDEIAAVLRRETWLGYDVIGALTPASDTNPRTPSGIEVLGNAEDAPEMVDEVRADLIFFAGGAHSSASQLRQAVWDLEQHHVRVVVAPSVTEIAGERVNVRPVAGLPLMYIESPHISTVGQWGKRIFDVGFSALLLVLFLPLFAIAAVSIKLHDRGPVLFRQTRIGLDRRQFTCLKFRSMVRNAEDLLPELREELRYDEGLFKLPDDPRITGPGRWLRRYSIDELPQLVNVLRGDMSLVGPRPPLPEEVAGYHEHVHRRLRVRPGMTGLWQVSGRSDLSWSEAVRLDLFYVDNWSMVQDLSILSKTVGAVLRSRGAY